MLQEKKEVEDLSALKIASMHQYGNFFTALKKDKKDYS